MCSQLCAGSQARPQEEGDPQGPPYKWQGGAGAGCCRFVLDALACGQPKPAKNGGKGKGSKGKGRGRALAPTDSEENVAEKEADAISEVPENEIPQEDDLGERPAGAGKIKRRRRLAHQGRCEGACQAGQEKEGQTGQKRPQWTRPKPRRRLAKQWLSFRKTELDRMKAASDPRSYQDKLKDIASRHGCLSGFYISARIV